MTAITLTPDKYNKMLEMFVAGNEYVQIAMAVDVSLQVVESCHKQMGTVIQLFNLSQIVKKGEAIIDKALQVEDATQALKNWILWNNSKGVDGNPNRMVMQSNQASGTQAKDEKIDNPHSAEAAETIKRMREKYGDGRKAG